MTYTYGAIDGQTRQAGSPRTHQRTVLVIATCSVALLGLSGFLMQREESVSDELLGVYPYPSISLAFVDAGSNSIAYSPWAANGEMRRERETMVGEPGWEPGPDYYSTVKWDNEPIYPDTSHRLFDPYTGHEGCTSCNTSKGAVVFSVTPGCDSSGTTTNVKRILRPVISDPFRSTVWANSRYEEWKWADHQLGYLLAHYEDLTVVIPPCFIPRYAFSWRALGVMNEAIYQRGMSVLIVGGLSGIDFLSRFLAGNDGYGYLDADTGDMQGASGTSALNRVWPQGPFYQQNDAASTVLLYGPRMLRSVGVHVVGVRAQELPPGTKHYYMTDEEVSVVFEVPAGKGRIIFVGYDYDQIEPRWADVLLLAERELQLKDQDQDPEPQPKEYPQPYGVAKPNPPSAEGAGAEEEELDNDIRKLVNYYCAQWMGQPNGRSLSKCMAQDCDNNRALDLGGGETFEFCHWMNPHGFCYNLEAAEYCDEHEDDTVQCFDAENNLPDYKYDPEDCGF